ncbi:MAG: glycosyltransferase [Solirubrobacteraceae bacterium]|jgi:glycosyltransferase involved in cell wall biosynthesis
MTPTTPPTGDAPMPRPASPPDAGRRLLVVSHPASVTANQIVYAALDELGWEVHLVIPSHWIDDFGSHRYATRFLPELAARGRRVAVIMAGRPQRHLYRARVASIIAAVAPAVAFLEQEPFSASAWQWGTALRRAGVPFAVAQDENLKRRLPAPARFFARGSLRGAGLVAARSPRAAELVTGVPTAVVPHPVTESEPAPPRPASAPFVAGYAGRLVAEKGILDLLAAVEALPEVRLLVVGDGPLRDRVTEAAARTGRVELRADVRHDDMPGAYAAMDVLVLPSHTTPTWAEQFGRVLVEALWSGVPVIGSDSGEIPWVISATEGGLVFPEGDVGALTVRLETMRRDPELRRRRAAAGRARVVETFSMTAVARQLDSLLGQLAAGRRLVSA